MDPIYESYQEVTKVDEAKIRYNGRKPTIKLKKKITITVEADILPAAYINTQTGEAETEEQSADIKYDWKKMETEIERALIPEIEKLVGYKVANTGGTKSIGFPNIISNAAYASGKWY